MAVIAMPREFGTRGSEVAAGVADRLGLEIIPHAVMEHVIAERSGMTEDEVHQYLEGELSLVKRWTFDREGVTKYTTQGILELAAKGNVLIRGWGATYILKSIPHVLCARIWAPMRYREAVWKERLGEAQGEIRISDAAHKTRMESLFGPGWEDPSLYAIVLDSARVPVKDCIEQIVRLTESAAFQETQESRNVLRDHLKVARSPLGESYN